MKKVVFINHSDTRGGASVVTYRLMKALRANGVDARMIVMHKASGNTHVDVAEPAWRRKAAFLAEHAEIFARNGFSRENLFRISTARFGMPLHDHPWVREADAVGLAWINQGMLSLKEIERIAALGKPVVWTMHDMWNLTGVCHHAGECMRWTEECGNCPLIWNGRLTSDLSTAVFRRKKALYGRVPLRFVAVSSWLADKCRRSALLAGADLHVIPNAFPVDDFRTSTTVSRMDLGLPESGPLIVMGAARLDDPVKNLPLAVETLNAVSAPGAKAVFYGDIRNPEILSSLKMPHVWLGTIADRRRLAAIYARASVVLSTSLYETLPGTLIEGMAAGAVPVTTGRGGQRDIVDHGTTGFIADSDDPALLASYIDRALTAPPSRESLHRAVAEKFSADAVAKKYIEILFSQH